MELTKEQLEAVEKIEDWFEGAERYFCLQGAAGTGKTTVIKTIIERISKYFKVVATSTTNASVRVLKDSIGNEDVLCITTHQYLRLKVVTTRDGTSIKTDEEKEPLTMYDLVIVDECSMVGEDLWDKINNYPTTAKWLFVGDPCQLSPVGCSISPTFSKVEFSFALKTIHRQAPDSPICSLVRSIRSSILANKFIISKPESKANSYGSIITTTDKKEWMSGVVKWFLEESYSTNDSRVITYTNRAERTLNFLVRKFIMGEVSEQCEFLPGETLFLKEPILDGHKVVLSSNSKLTVVSSNLLMYSTNKFHFKLPSKDFVYNSVKCKTEDEDTIRIKVLSLKSVESYQDYVKMLKKNKHIELGVLNDLNREFIDVSYQYATTVRRAQGWNLRFVAFSLPELTKCRGISEKLYNYYSATSRASNRVLILN